MSLRPFEGPSTSSEASRVDGDSGYNSSASTIGDSRGVRDASLGVDYSSEGRVKVHSYGFDNRTASTSTAHDYLGRNDGSPLPLIDRERVTPCA